MNRSKDLPVWEIEDGITEAVYGTTEDFEKALKAEAPHALELQRGISVRLDTKAREEIDKALGGIADRLTDDLLDLKESMLPPDLLEEAEKFADRLRGWKNEALHELLHDLQKALVSRGGEKVQAARLESLVRAVREVIGYEPAPAKRDTAPVDTKPPADETVGQKFKRLAHA